jgi:hypothetical protein
VGEAVNPKEPARTPRVVGRQGRPLQVYLTAEIMQKLEEIAKSEKLSKAETVRKLIAEWEI